LSEDGDAFNAGLQASRQGQSWSEIWADFDQTRQALTARVAALSQAELAPTTPASLPFYPDPYHCVWSALEHYLDHATILRREALLLATAMPKWLLAFHGPYT
jgi:hypothetical protein